MYQAPGKKARMYDRETRMYWVPGGKARMYDKKTRMYRSLGKETRTYDRETIGLALLALKEGMTQKEAANCAVRPKAR